MHVFVRRDLPWSQRAVQAAHAAANLVFSRRATFDERAWGAHGPNFVFYGVPGERELLELEASLGSLAVSFREPDMADRLTAIAYLGPSLPGFDQMHLL
jgi:hypothetical protein